jgi:hypothetical protein
VTKQFVAAFVLAVWEAEKLTAASQPTKIFLRYQGSPGLRGAGALTILHLDLSGGHFFATLGGLG